MSEKQGAVKRKKEAKEVTTEKKAPEEKKDKADVDIDKRKPTSKSSGDGSKAKKSHQQKGINPCVILVLVLMLLSGAYVLWVNISDSTTGELEGSLEGSQLASTLRYAQPTSSVLNQLQVMAPSCFGSPISGSVCAGQ